MERSRRGLDDVAAIDGVLAKLHDAVAAGLPRSRCLRRWSEFIRLRDGHRCVDCHSREHLSAHHICRKSFFEQAQFETGNGITLCRECHREAEQRGFDEASGLGQASGERRGASKLPLMERFYSILLDDAVRARACCRDGLLLSERRRLGSFKRMQGYKPTTEFPGSRLRQASSETAEESREHAAPCNRRRQRLRPSATSPCYRVRSVVVSGDG